MGSYALGIDLGTSSVKALAVDGSGRMTTTAAVDYPLLRPRPDWVEQNPEDWWQAVCQAVRSVLREAGIAAPDIRGVALSGHINGAVFVDRCGRLLRTAIIWLDHRSQAECDLANAQVGDLFRSQTLRALNPAQTLAKVLWVRHHEPEIYGRTAAILPPKDWLRYRLTGVLCVEISDASTTGAFDLYRRSWSMDILERLDLKPELFPQIVPSSAVVGQVTDKAAEATGLAAGTPVCAGGGDIPCMVLGSGAIAPGVVSVGIGTAGHAITAADRVSDAAVDQLWPMCHPVPGKYAWLGCTLTGGASLSWLRDVFGLGYEAMTEEAATAPPASEGLFFMPWLEGMSIPCPDTRATGGFVGLTLRHTRGHMVRALMEGVVFDLRHCLECFKSLGLPLHEIRMGEGGSRTSLWGRIQADVFGQDLRVVETRDFSAVGAALIAGVGTGLFPDFDAACATTIKLGDTVCCDPERAAVYEDAFQRYRALYPALKGWFNAEG